MSDSLDLSFFVGVVVVAVVLLFFQLVLVVFVLMRFETF
jgi:hypothetical protein